MEENDGIRPCGDDDEEDEGNTASFDLKLAELEKEGEGDGEPSWTHMPTELWLSIIRLLSYRERAALACTCRRLSAIVGDRSLWRVIHLDRYQKLDDNRLAAIGRRRPQELQLSYCRGDSVTTRGECFFLFF